MKTSFLAMGLLLLSQTALAAQSDCRVYVKGMAELMDHDSALESSVGMVLMKKNIELISRRDVQESDIVIQDLFGRGTRSGMGVFLPGFVLKYQKSSAQAPNCGGAFSCASFDGKGALSSVEYNQDFLISRLDREGLRDLGSQNFKFAYTGNDIQQSMDDIIGNSQEARKLALAIAGSLPSCEDLGKMQAGAFVRKFDVDEAKVSAAPALPSAQISSTKPSMPSVDSVEKSQLPKNIKRVISWNGSAGAYQCFLSGPNGERLSKIADINCATKKKTFWNSSNATYECYLAGANNEQLRGSHLADSECAKTKKIFWNGSAGYQCYLAGPDGEQFKRSLLKDSECATKKKAFWNGSTGTYECHLAGPADEQFLNSRVSERECADRTVIQYDSREGVYKCYLAGQNGEVFKQVVYKDEVCGKKKMPEYDRDAGTYKCYLAGPEGQIFKKSVLADRECATKSMISYDRSAGKNKCYLAGPQDQIFKQSVLSDIECAKQ